MGIFRREYFGPTVGWIEMTPPYRAVKLVPTTFASLPPPVEGNLAAITDCATNQRGATVTGGGSFHAMIYYTGTKWIVAGI